MYRYIYFIFINGPPPSFYRQHLDLERQILDTLKDLISIKKFNTRIINKII